MADTSSNMLPLGTSAPFFELTDTVSGTVLNINSLKGKQGTVIMFICNHCPFVIHVIPKLVELANEFKTKGIRFIAISSNDAVSYPQDAPEKMKILAELENYPFPYLYDESQEIAKKYSAACTPDFYVFNADLELSYRGQLDDSRPGNNISVTGIDIKHALNCLIENNENTQTQKPSIGCSIKWKK